MVKGYHETLYGEDPSDVPAADILAVLLPEFLEKELIKEGYPFRETHVQKSTSGGLTVIATGSHEEPDEHGVRGDAIVQRVSNPVKYLRDLEAGIEEHPEREGSEELRKDIARIRMQLRIQRRGESAAEGKSR